MQIALSIAGFDPSSGAGVSADLAVFAAHGLFGTACLTAMTVQSTRGVRSVTAVSPRLLRKMLDELCGDLPPSGIKIGMLANAAIATEVVQFLERFGAKTKIPVVLDPVLRSSSGHALLAADAIDVMRRRLVPLVDWITPNVAELGALVGREMLSATAIEAAAHELQMSLGAGSVVVTGGDQKRPDDLLVSGDGVAEWVNGDRIDTAATHGTGCAFSSALLAGLLAGRNAGAAVSEAKRYVEEALRRAPGLGAGNGPAELLWTLGRDHIPR